MFNVDAVRQEFPILSQEVNGKPLVYLDNAATTQKPQAVIDAICDYYQSYNSNVHRGAHKLADQATRAYEAAREDIARFINAPASCELIWTAGTTEARSALLSFRTNNDLPKKSLDEQKKMNKKMDQLIAVSGGSGGLVGLSI